MPFFFVLYIFVQKKHHQEAPYPQDPDERADKAEDDMWYVLQENDELKAKIEVHC